MKTNILITLALVMGMMLTGCSKEETEKFMIDMEQVSILVGDDYKVTPSGAFTARSTDEDVATVSAEGVIHGVSAGDADVIFTSTEDGQTQTCKVSVGWKYHYFEEPILDFSMTLEQLKDRETHEYNSDNLWEPGIGGPQSFPDPWLARYWYQNEDGKILITYCWADKSDGDIYMVHMGWSRIDNKNVPQEKIRQQLMERYGDPTTAENGIENEYRSERFKIRVIEGWSYVQFYPF